MYHKTLFVYFQIRLDRTLTETDLIDSEAILLFCVSIVQSLFTAWIMFMILFSGCLYAEALLVEFVSSQVALTGLCNPL